MTLADTSTQAGFAQIAVAAEAWAKVVALFVAGVWTYLLFVRQRQRFPRATVVQTGMIRDLDDSRRLLTVTVALSNIGQRLLQIDYVTIVVQQLAPLSATALRDALASHDPLNAAGRREILWYRIGHRRTGFESNHFEIEPGETERVEFDFTISRSVRSIKIQTHIENVVRRFSARDWIRGVLAPVSVLTIRSTNRCLGWQCTTYHNLAPSVEALVKLPNVSNPENADDNGR